MSKRHLRYVVRYRHPRRIKPRLVVEYPPLVRPTLMRKCLRVLSLMAAALFVGFALALTHSHETEKYVPVQVMAGISFVDAGTWALDVTDPGAVPCAIPAGAGETDMMIAGWGWKDYSITHSVNTAGWAGIGTEFADGTVSQASGVGSMKVMAYWKEHSGSESDPTFAFSVFPNINGRVMLVFSKDPSETWETPVDATAAIADATNWTATASSDPGGTGGDCIIGLVAFRDNSATMTRDANAGLDWDGITWTGDYQEAPAAHHDTSAGPDMSADMGYRIAASGTSSAAPTMAGTLGASETGSAKWIRLRVTGGGGGGGDTFFENRHPIEQGMKPQTAAGMGGVLIE